jgi:hypothetical protein
MPTEIDNTIRGTHLQRRINLRKKHSYRRERLHERSALTEIYSTMEALPRLERNYSEESLHGGSPLTVETYTFLPTFYDDYDNFSEHNCYGQSKSTYPTVFHNVNELYIRDVPDRGNAFELLSIAALPASPWHPDCFSDLDSHHNRHTSPLTVLVTG